MGFTKNYYIIKRRLCVGGSSSDYRTFTEDTTDGYLVRTMDNKYALVSYIAMSSSSGYVSVLRNFVDMNSSLVLTAKGFTQSTSLSSVSSAYNMYFYIGNGDAAETEDDYKLSGSTLSCSLTSISSVATKITNGTSVTYNLSITNNTSSAYTVKEFGIAFPCLVSSSPSYKPVLIYRKTLLTPVELAAGEIAVLRFTVNQTLST